MAGGVTVISPAGDNNNYNGKVTWFVIISCISAAMGGVLFGYDIGISGGVTSMEPFLQKFFPSVYLNMKEDTKISNYCKFNSELLTSFTSSLYVAGLVASLFASIVTKVYGRKPSIIIGGLAFLVGSVIGGAALNIYMLILGRLLLGVGVGFANQKKYAQEIIEKASMSNCKPSATPVDSKGKMNSHSGTPYDDPTFYRKLYGALQYLTFSHPNIPYVIEQVCLFMHAPLVEHMPALKRIIRYIQGSCVFLGENLISWSSKRQPTLSMSSAETEYRGVANVVSESCWVRNLLFELRCPIS